jgi:hypothetical protein
MSTGITTSSHTIVLQPGESFVLPAGGSIVYTSDPEGLNSECADIPTTTYKCGYFFLVLDADDNSGHSMDSNTRYVSVKVGNTTFPLDEVVVFGSGNSPTPATHTTLNNHITDTGLFEFMQVTETEVTSRTHIHVYFKVLDSFFDDVLLIVNNNNVNSISYYPPIEAECDEYPNPD